MSSAGKHAEWHELCEAMRERQAALLAFDPFREGMDPAERLAEWNKLDDAMGEALGLMEQFLRSLEQPARGVT